MPAQLRRLLSGLGATYHGPDLAIGEVVMDEREACPGALFVARRGYYGDSHDRIGAALDRGAAAVVVEDAARAPTGVPTVFAPRSPDFLGRLADRFYGSPTAGLTVYGVTGTNGKTSVAFLLEHLLEACGDRVALLSTVAYRVGGRSRPAVNTTPDALYVHRFARQAVRAGATALVLEVSSHALDLGRVAGVRFDAVGFTNLSREHLDHHGSMAAYRAAKRTLFGEVLIEALGVGKAPTAVACLDDGEGQAMLAATPEGTTCLGVGSSGLGGGVALAVAPASLPSAGIGRSPVRVLRAGEQALPAELPLVGAHNRANAAVALGMCALTRPDALPTALDALAIFPGVPGRLEAAADPCWAGRRVLVDYAHTPDALARATAAVTELGEGAPTVLVGCGGDRDPGKRGAMARIAEAGGGRAILTSDNPRGEDPGDILSAMQAGLAHAASAEVIPSRQRAIALALADGAATPVLIAGKGHEPYQERAGVRHHLDDCEEARRCLLARRAGVPAQAAPLLCGWTIERLASALGGEIARRGPRWPIGSVLLADSGLPGEPAAHAVGELRLLPGGLRVEVGAGVDSGLGHAFVRVHESDDPCLALLVALVTEAKHREGGLDVACSGAAAEEGGAGDGSPGPALVVSAPGEWAKLAPKHRALLLPAPLLAACSDALTSSSSAARDRPRQIPVPL